MSTAVFNSVTASITAFDNSKFTYSSEQIIFPGWKIVAKKYATDNKEYHYLQTVSKNETILYKKITSKVTIKGAKQHYTEARLVQLLEERGIGRPSTFSSIVDKIQERGYVKKTDVKGKEVSCKDFELENGEIFEIDTKREFGNEKNKLVIQQLGIIVLDFIEKHFSKLFDYDYTSNMETSLDKISKGDIIWHDVCKECNNEIDLLLSSLTNQDKIEIKLDENNTYLIGKYGPVIKCVEDAKEGEESFVTFKPIRKDVDIHSLENGSYKVEELIDTTKTKSQYTLGKYEGKDVILKKGKFGPYITWGENTKALRDLGNRPLENVTFEEIQKYLEEGSNFVREITSNISLRKGPKGDYIFYKTSKMKKPQFFDLKKFTTDVKKDYKTCDINVLKSWIAETYEIK
jgi:DNA topoisomerase-1